MAVDPSVSYASGAAAALLMKNHWEFVEARLTGDEIVTTLRLPGIGVFDVVVREHELVDSPGPGMTVES